MNAHELARRRLLGQAAATIPVLLAIPVLGRASAVQTGTASKDAFHYQDHPNEGKHCGNCAQFIPPVAGQQLGGCRIVAGAISTNGWCMAFTPK